ncbi:MULTISPECIES: cytochrome c3 family protein [Geobacter]|uniref:cytochrome c3 family protein n=1 Tax=Geobacter TaxID=28231 RepID=UPI002572A24B|nr:cytochrome c3 family protein [Geobacter sulfurreducens]BEH08705.1 cytochrome c3 family protein [Geobacter sulfurreducens subsp. ethanolicus]BET60192.1 cytochrome c3 family protein [Geobacter sp. 60473]HML77614.1 cytochrome c3 family protein [Geobacter sulfurreducens]
MRFIPATAALLIILTGSAGAIDRITYPTRIGAVVFPHKKHQDALGECRGCHEKGPGRIDGFDKVMAHGKGCKGCHEEMRMGPTRCGDCHKGGLTP